MMQVDRGGINWAKETRKLVPIDDGLALFELRVGGKVIRAMAYVHKNTTPAFLFDFKGHQGKTARIPSAVIDKGRALAVVAAKLMNEEDGSND